VDLACVFSSRRRHTRSYGDWSSDVCSSDLGSRVADTRESYWHRATGGLFGPPDLELGERLLIDCRLVEERDGKLYPLLELEQVRSEERRVGKESTVVGTGRDVKKKNRLLVF